MNDIMTGAALAILIIMQWFLVWECLRMRTTVSDHSVSLQTEMGNLGKLLDEALDFIAENVPSQGLLTAASTQPSMDFREAILSALISRMNMGGEHGTPQQEDRSVQFDQSQTTLETETESN